MNKENPEILLKVEHLKQYFQAGKFVTKAVDDVSFEIHKGEVFGLVGESGCGKTTTGRSIIKLNDITGGNIYFKGQRICAGYKDLQKNVSLAKKSISSLKKELNSKLKSCSENEKAQLQNEYSQKIELAEKDYRILLEDTKQQIRSAKDDHKNCDKKYAQSNIEKIKTDYQIKIEELTKASKIKEAEELTKKMKEEIEFGKKERIMHKMQMIFQDPIASLDPRMTVRETIAEGLIIRGHKDEKYIDEKVYQMLNLVGLVSEHAGRYPHEFSGGQRQRIGIARAVVLNPDLIIADEPISALDVSIQAQVINLLNDLRRELGLTILFIAHDLSVVKYFSDRIAVMYFGKIVEMTTSDELFAHPMHPYTKSLLSAIPFPDPMSEKKRKRITYNPVIDHHYEDEIPTLREVKEGHFVYCDSKEFETYKNILNNI